MDTLKRNNFLLNLSFVFFIIDVLLLSWWGANSRIEYVLPTFAFSFLAILPLCFMREQDFYNKFEKVIFFCGAYLVVYALIGYFNPSKEFLKYVDYTYLKDLPFIDYLPTSVKSPIIEGNALTSAMKIASAFFIVMFCIKAFRRQNYLSFAMNFLAINGTLVAIFGIVQKEMGFPILYDTFLTTSGFYATFFLCSASGAFINLSLAINLALLYLNLRNKRIIRSVIFLGFSGFCFYSARNSGSDGAIMLANITIVVAVIIVVFAGFNKLMKARYSFLLTVLYLSLIAFIFLGTTKLSYVEAVKSRSLDSRFEIYDISLSVLEQYPFFGVGGECSQYLLPSETNIIAVENNSKMLSAAPARAHMDILEYFMEFGVLGAWVIVLALLAYIFKFFSKIRYLGAENAILFTGVMLCVIHSMWDLVLHFQSIMIYIGIVAILSLNQMRSFDDEV